MIPLKEKKELISYQLIIDRQLLADFKSKCATNQLAMSKKIREMIAEYVGE